MQESFLSHEINSTFSQERKIYQSVGYVILSMQREINLS